MTNQELYSKVRTHLLTQMKQSRRPNHGLGGCAYRGSDSLRCAIGCLIPDERYFRTLEGFTVWTRAVATAAGLADAQIPLASDLQGIHDITPVYSWLEELDHVARKYHLEAR